MRLITPSVNLNLRFNNNVTWSEDSPSILLDIALCLLCSAEGEAQNFARTVYNTRKTSLSVEILFRFGNFKNNGQEWELQQIPNKPTTRFFVKAPIRGAFTKNFGLV